MPQEIRIATADDANELLAMYSPIVRETWISFELEPPSIEEMRNRISNTVQQLPWLVYESNGSVDGYAYASRHRERAAYQWSVDVSAYVRPDIQRRGIARALYRALLAVLRVRGFVHAFAGIALPNDASVRFHESMGFESIGVYRSVGYKLGAWRDVGWWQYRLQDPMKEPKAPCRLADILETPEFKSALHAHLAEPSL